MDVSNRTESGSHKAGGASALYLAAAYIVAMPYFMLLVDYPGATTAAAKITLILENHSSLLAMYLATYVVFGIVLGVLALALHDRLRVAAPFAARVATAIGLLWAFALVASGMIFNYGMTAVVNIAGTDRARAEMTWQAIEAIAQGLGGAGGELLGGLWVLLVSWIALRGHVLPKALNWLGLAIGVAGLASVVPQLQPIAYAFGLLQILWFAWLGVAMLRAGGVTARAERSTVVVSAQAPGR